LTKIHAISIAVLSTDRDNVEQVNSSLRDADHAAHSHWIETPAQFDQIVGAEPLEIIILNVDTFPDSIKQVVKLKDGYIPEVPVIAVGNSAKSTLKRKNNFVRNFVGVRVIL
jgi:hypothetical protein